MARQNAVSAPGPSRLVNRINPGLPALMSIYLTNQMCTDLPYCGNTSVNIIVLFM